MWWFCVSNVACMQLCRTRWMVLSPHISLVGGWKYVQRALHLQLLYNWIYTLCTIVSNKTCLTGYSFNTHLPILQFLPHDAMHKRGLCHHAVSVCLSVTFMDHVETNKHIFEIFSPSGSHAILVFPYQTGWRYSDGNPHNGGVKCRWGRQKTRF